MSDRGHDRLARGLLLLFLASCLLVCAKVLQFPLWLAPLPAALALASPLRRLPRTVQTAAQWTLSATLLALFVVGFIQALYPVLPPEQIRDALRALAWALCALATLFGFGVRVLAPGRALLPAGLGLLLASALCVSGERRPLDLPPLVPWPLLALAAYLVYADDTLAAAAARGLGRRRWLRLAATLAIAVVAAFGFMRLLPWVVPLVDQLFADRGGSASTGFGGESRLGDIERLALDESVALRLWTDEPRPLRLRVATRFARNAWRVEPELLARRAAQPLHGPDPPAFAPCAEAVPGRTFTLAHETAARPGLRCVQVLPTQELRTDSLPTTSGSALVRTASERVDVDAAGIVTSPDGYEPALFGFAAQREPPSAAAESPQMIAACLAVPEDLDPRLRALAAALSRDTPGPADRVAATVRHLQGTCHYSLEVGQFHTRDALAEFLFEKRRGYCEYFASAAAVLLRLQGVPTRYVTGFATRAADRQAGHYVVRMSDAHAWVEAYIDGRWQEVDPTPAAEYDQLHARHSHWWDTAAEAVRAGWLWLTHAVRQAVRSADFLWLGRLTLAALRLLFVDHLRVTLAALVLVVAMRLRIPSRLARWRERRPSRRPRLDPSQTALTDVFMQLERLLARRGAPRPASRPPLEHVRALPADKVEPALRVLAADVVAALYAALFQGALPDPAAVAALGQRLRDVDARRHTG